MAMPMLPVQRMYERHWGLTQNIADCYLEAARVCLDRFHLSPQEFVLSDDSQGNTVQVSWDPADARTKAAWANQDDATRDGAYACALAAAELARGLVAVARAETRTGADYYIAPLGQEIEDLESCYRLEVSGTNLEDAVVKTRLKIKVEQAKAGKSNLPALASVVGFRARLIMLQTVR
jgi:hypothetical protein